MFLVLCCSCGDEVGVACWDCRELRPETVVVESIAQGSGEHAMLL